MKVKSENSWKTKSMLPANRKDHQLGIHFSCIQQKLYFRNYQIRSYYFSKIFMSKAELHSVIGWPNLLPSLCSVSLMSGLLLMVALCPQKGNSILISTFQSKGTVKRQEERGGSTIRNGIFSRNHTQTSSVFSVVRIASHNPL